jgi:hypothetical protein
MESPAIHKNEEMRQKKTTEKIFRVPQKELDDILNYQTAAAELEIIKPHFLAEIWLKPKFIKFEEKWKGLTRTRRPTRSQLTGYN